MCGSKPSKKEKVIECRMCGYKFSEKDVSNRGCMGCGKHCTSKLHCPNCGYGNSSDYEQEFAFIKKLKEKLKTF